METERNTQRRGMFNRLEHWLSSWRNEPTDDQKRGELWAQLRSIEALAFRAFVFVGLFILIYSIAQAQDALGRDTFKILGILIGETIAAAAFGGFLGFLFGIPRLLQHAGAVVQQAGDTPPGQTGSAAQRFLSSNTNLEEISDWLTKIIVGISLVQANTIITYIREAAEIFQSNALPDAVGADVVFVLVLISGTVFGFLFFYMETRTRVTMLFTDIEKLAGPPSAISEPRLRDAVLNAPIARSMSDPEALGSDGPTTSSPAPISEDKKILALPYSSLKTVDDLAAWASAQARANNFSAAIRALQDAIAKKPGDSDLLLRLADIQQRRGNARAVYDTISEARSKSDDDPDILMRELMASLYLPAPDSFQNAIPIAEKLTSMPGAMDEPFVWLWTAAAQGQRYRWLSENNGDVAQQTDARSKALDAVLKVTRLAPDPKSYPRALLRQLFNPEREKSPPGENDLEVFKSDPEFQAVIYPNG